MRGVGRDRIDMRIEIGVDIIVFLDWTGPGWGNEMYRYGSIDKAFELPLPNSKLFLNLNLHPPHYCAQCCDYTLYTNCSAFPFCSQYGGGRIIAYVATAYIMSS